MIMRSRRVGGGPDRRRARFRLGLGIFLAVLFVLQPLALLGPAFDAGAPLPPEPRFDLCCFGGEEASLPSAPPAVASCLPGDPVGERPDPCCPEGCRRCPRSCCGGVLAPPAMSAGQEIPLRPGLRARPTVADSPSASRDDVFHPPRA